MPRVLSVAAVLSALLCAIAPPTRSQEQAPGVVALRSPAELRVDHVGDGCRQTLVVPGAAARAELTRFSVAYYRAEGCRSWPLAREVEGLRTALGVLLWHLPDRALLSGFQFGRVMQPEFRRRIAAAALARGLEALPDDRDLALRLRAALAEDDVFRELRGIFAEHGLALSLRSLEKIERPRPRELAQWEVERDQLPGRPAETARIPVAAIVWFEIAER